MDYLMQLTKFFSISKNVVYHMQFLEFLFLLQKRGLSYGIYEISFPSQKMWTILRNLSDFNPFSKNMDYHMKLLEFLFLLQKHGLSYAVNGISILSLKTWS